jgi:hypothetical protein
MNGSEIIRKFYSALPAVKNWIEDLLEEHHSGSTVVSTLGFQRLPQHFPDSLLEGTKVVTVSEVPFPPLSQLGLEELSAMEHMSLAGITYKDTFFVHEHQRTESLHFHELVHVVQWERLGVDNFLLTYGVGLVQCGYERSPLEEMAYNLQRSFDQSVVPGDLVEFIRQKTDAIWQQTAPLVGQ